MKDDRIETRVQRFLGDQKDSEKEDGKRVRRKQNGKNVTFSFWTSFPEVLTKSHLGKNRQYVGQPGKQ